MDKKQEFYDKEISFIIVKTLARQLLDAEIFTKEDYEKFMAEKENKYKPFMT